MEDELKNYIILKGNVRIYECSFCNYSSNNKCKFTSHLLTEKHKKMTSYKVENDLKICKFCLKKYKTSKGIRNHLIICKSKKLLNSIDDGSNNIKLVENNQLDNIAVEYKEKCDDLLTKDKPEMNLTLQIIKLMIDFCKSNNDTTLNVAKEILNKNSIHSSNNKTIINASNQNVSMEKLIQNNFSNALNTDEIVEKYESNVDKLLEYKELGYVNGTIKSITDTLKKLPIENRGIICSDKKRNSFYVKNSDNEWKVENKEKGYNNLIGTFKGIAKKNIGSYLNYVTDMRSGNYNKTDEHKYKNIIPEQIQIRILNTNEDDNYKIVKGLSDPLYISKEDMQLLITNYG